jgi:DNA polymerase-3 subunit delta'
MQFKNIVGQQHIKNKLIQTVKNGRISHTQLFLGAEGVGALPLAVAYAQYINCPNATEEDSCGTCTSCVKFSKLIHPDLHFTFPTIAIDKKKLSNEFIAEWREAFTSNPYLSELEWVLSLDSEGKKQGNITAEECRDIIRKLGLKPYEAKYKTVIIWLPEYMRTEGNILLKLLEEPPEQTLIILVAQDADKVIATILSRAQTMRIPRLNEDEIAQYLIDKYEATPDVAGAVARISEGSLVQASSLIQAGHANYFEMFTTWMRLCYNSRKEIEALISWVEVSAVKGREFLKSYLIYCQHMLRSSFVFKFGDPKLLRLNEHETAFIQRFSASLTEENITPIVQEINRSTMQLERNADLKITFLNLSLYIGRLLDKQRAA